MNELLGIYPFNLACGIFRGNKRALEIYIPNLPAVLGTLMEREQEILLKRYRDKMTLKAIGAEYKISAERVRQIEAKALRKLQHPQWATMLIAVPLSEMKKEREEYRKLSQEYELLVKAFGCSTTKMQTPLERLNLSIRSYNRLKRAGKQTLRDIADMSKQELLQVRNLGFKSVMEVIGVLKAYGVELK